MGSLSQDDVMEPVVKKHRSGYLVRYLSAQTGFGRTNDEIHSTVDFCPVMKAVMDTPQFQRLRHLKQLGTSEYAYMNVNHNRFEHSVGVAHLAQRMCKRIQRNQENLRISDKDILCVKMAGLLHDLGHGPFSHIYDGPFLVELEKYLQKNPRLREQYEDIPERPPGWAHEDGSHMMIDALLEDLGLRIDMDNLDQPLQQVGDGITAESMRVFTPMDDDVENRDTNRDLIMTSRDWVFIKEMITAEPLIEQDFRHLPPDESGFVGRPKRSQEFLYDIVSNRHNGLDVDKIDYFARDQRRSFRGAGEVEARLIEEAVVAWGDCPRPHKCFRCKCSVEEQHLMICYPDKMVVKAMEFFHTRFLLHSNVYTHKTTQAATFMIADILSLADPFFRIPTSMDGDNRKTAVSALPISRAMLDPVAYLRLRDSIIDQIMYTTSPELKPARALINRLWHRKLYKCVKTRRIHTDNIADTRMWDKKEEEIKQEILQLRGRHESNLVLEEADLIVEKHKIHHGSKAENPLMLMRFIPKHERAKLNNPIENLPVAVQVDEDKYRGHIPREFQEQNIRFFCRTREKMDLLRHILELWEQQNTDQYGGLIVTHEDSGGDDGSVQNEEIVRELTQESDSDMTPMRRRTPADDFSPVPTGRSFAQQPIARRRIFP